MRIAVIETAVNVRYGTLLRVKNAVDKYLSACTAHFREITESQPELVLEREYAIDQ